MNYSHLTDMLQVYFECNKNSRHSVRVYRERFPNREIPQHQKFARLEKNLRTYGAFKKQHRTVRQFHEEVELNTLLAVQENPRISIRDMTSNIGTSKLTVGKILKKHKFKSYIPQKVQALEDNDQARRINFCQTFLNMVEEDPLFSRNIIWTDECTFNSSGIFNRNIHRYWSQENPRIIVDRNFQRRFSVNLWCGILGDMLIGPFFIDGALNQEKYYQLLTNEIEIFLDELPLPRLDTIYFQQDGAPPHNARLNINYLNGKFGRNWIGTSGPIRWPARSPDITPLDFWLWGYLQDAVYLTHVENEAVLRQRIINVCRQIPPNIILNATNEIRRRCQVCIEQGGRQFEQYL